MNFVVIVVYWCLASAPIDTFNPHQLGAVKAFVAANPATCHVSPGEVLGKEDGDMGITVDECRAHHIIAYMPGWLQKPENKGRLYLGADCIEQHPDRPDPIDMQALKDKVTP